MSERAEASNSEETDGTVPDEISHLVGHSGHLLRRSYQIFISIFESSFSQMGVSPVEYMILGTLEALGTLDMSSVAGSAAIDNASCFRVVGRLEDRGLVETCRGDKDQRRRLVGLTARGRTIMPSLHKCAAMVEARMFERLTAQERGDFAASMKAFATRNNCLSRAPFRAPARTEKGDG
ncbi:MarR family transcriptional regulator [Parasphingopyxis sp.]|uniref:MarR family winged helix-turn-helix transcriptional regulator n=1 Tax=Parasphingopyxis sp. TaxID=1920299 RepID=UPI00261F378C|nr:MarR family transcriptional regulator [Parasphingopyxis sp.]